MDVKVALSFENCCNDSVPLDILKQAVENRIVIDKLAVPFNYQCPIDKCSALILNTVELEIHLMEHFEDSRCVICYEGVLNEPTSIYTHCATRYDREHTSLRKIFAEGMSDEKTKEFEACWTMGQLTTQQSFFNLSRWKAQSTNNQ